MCQLGKLGPEVGRGIDIHLDIGPDQGLQNTGDMNHQVKIANLEIINTRMIESIYIIQAHRVTINRVAGITTGMTKVLNQVIQGI